MESRDESKPTATESSDVQSDQFVGKGIENALKRKERLKKLREQRKRPRPESSDPEQTEEGGNEHQLASGGKAEREEALPKPLFRTYRPADTQLRELELPDSKPENIDKQVKENLTSITNESVLDRDINIHTLQSHKPDWDIKRGIAKQLEKLDRRTKRAIAELVRERLQADKDAKANLAQAVKVAQPEIPVDSDDD